MEAVLWYVLTGTRGGPNRVRILRALDDRPRNANRLAEDLDLDYKTVRHHLDVLVDNDVVVSSGDDYGAVYVPSGQARTEWDVVETIFDRVDDEPEDRSSTDGADSTDGGSDAEGPDA
jgi:DNA-binding transcriptional ArsR family regulator